MPDQICLWLSRPCSHTMFNLPTPGTSEPMQIDHTQISPEKHQATNDFNCTTTVAKPLIDAPSAQENMVTRPAKVSPPFCPLSFQLPIQIHYVNLYYDVSALVDSGSAINIIHHQLIQELILHHHQSRHPTKDHAGGSPADRGWPHHPPDGTHNTTG